MYTNHILISKSLHVHMTNPGTENKLLELRTGDVTFLVTHVIVVNK